MNKKASRLRRASKTRARIKRLGALRLTVHRSANHIYAQITNVAGKVVAMASSLEQSIRDQSTGGNVKSATLVGKLIAERAQQAGVNKVAFDRSGFKYHGRIKALADAARESGIVF